MRCFDLLGLPPRPKQIEEFTNDTRSDAYERLIDRLLASPRYGERWARHWLDAVRYADTGGFENGVSGLPCVAVINANGDAIKRNDGYLPPEPFLAWLRG